MRSIFVPAVAWLFALFLVFGAYSNGLPSDATLASYARWGYPSGFNYVTATLEFGAALLLVLPRTRLHGAVLAGVIMLAAAGTLILHAGLRPAVPPLLASATSVVLVAMLLRDLRPGARRLADETR